MGKEINQVVDRLFHIEDASVKVVSQAEKEKKEYTAVMEKKTQDYDRDMDQKQSQKLEEIKTELMAKSKKELEDWLNQANTQFSKIDASYSARHSQMARQILEEMLKV